MKRRPKPEEYRMKASEFDKMMRRALAPPTSQERKSKVAKKAPKKAAPKKSLARRRQGFVEGQDANG